MKSLDSPDARASCPMLPFEQRKGEGWLVSKRVSARLGTAVALGSLLALAAGCGPRHEASGARAQATVPPAPVRVQPVVTSDLASHEEVVGTVRARVRATLEAKISGRIAEMPVRLGQKVEAGQLVARLEAAEVRARLEQAEAALQQTERELKRVKSLYEQQATTRAEYENAESRFLVAKGTLEEARAMLAYVEVRAPFQGVVTRKWADVGDLAAPGKPLVNLEDPQHLQVEADIPEALAGRIGLGAKLAIRADGVPNNLVGTVEEIAPVADSLSRTVQVKLDLPAGAPVRPGQFARLLAPVGETKTLSVPASAVVRRGQLELVFVVTTNTAQLHLVKTGRHTSDAVEIVSGLDAGDSVVVEGAQRLVDGQPVTLQ